MASKRTFSDPIMFGLQNLFSGLQQGISTGQQNQLDIVKQFQEQRRKEAQIKSLEDYYVSKGLPAQLAHQPEFVQKEALKAYSRPKSLVESLPDLFSSLFGSGNQQPRTGIQIGNQGVSADQLSPETMQNLQMLNQENIVSGQPSSFGTKVGNLLSGFGTQALGTPGDIASLGLRALDFLKAPQQEVSPQEKQKALDYWKNQIEQRAPDSAERRSAEDILRGIEKGPATIEPAIATLPHTENIRKGVKAATEGTQAEKYLNPTNAVDKKWQDIGGSAALLTRPSTAWPALAKNIFKATGVSLGGEVAEWLTKTATGSEELGNKVKNGLFLAYNLFPGLSGKLSKQGYDQFTDKVITPALEQGKNVDMKSVLPEFNDLAKKIDKRFVPTSAAGKFLRNEAAKIQEFFEPNVKTNPEALWNSIKEMGSYYKKVPAQARGVFKELIDLQKNALSKFSDSITPGGGKLLERANDLFKTTKDIEKDLSFVKQVANPRNYGPGALIWLGGGYPLIMKFSIAEAGRRFVSNMLQSPAIRDTISNLAKSSAAQNTIITQKLVKRLDNESNKILNKMPMKDQEQIKDALKKVED